MVATTINQDTIPPIFYEDGIKAEIRSINDVFPEYTMDSVSGYKSNIKDILYSYYSNYSNFYKSIMLNNTNINMLSGVIMSKYYKAKSEIEILEHLYKFKSNFIYSITKEEEGFIAENEYFNIFGYGDTAEEAEKELYEYINDLWECYVEEDDENLDESAIKLKENLLENIRKIY